MSADSFVVIVEGCDKCGKTSLASGLSDALGWPVVKFGPPRTDPFIEYMSALEANPGPFVADRFHLGESVYGPIYRNTPPLSGYATHRIESELSRRGALLVLMRDDADGIRRRFLDLGENFAKTEHVEAILSAFDRLWSESKLPRIRMRWHPGLPEVIKHVVMEMTS